MLSTMPLSFQAPASRPVGMYSPTVAGKRSIRGEMGQVTEWVIRQMTYTEEDDAETTREGEKLMDEPSTQPITVIVADDHPVVREGLRSILTAAGIEVVGEATTGTEAVALVLQWRPDVVIMDIRMPEMDGLSAMAALKRQSSAASVIVLTGSTNLQQLVRSVVYGAAGYFLKGISPDELVSAVQTVAKGKSLLTVHDLRNVLDHVLKEDAKTAPFAVARMGTLTGREREIIGLMVQGLTNKQIGEVLSVSAATVRAHVEHIIAKLGVSNRTQAAVWAVRAGIVTGM